MMHIDCQTCPARDVRCADCVVTALLTIPPTIPLTFPLGSAPAESGSRDGPESAGLVLDSRERRAVSVFLAAGLVSSHTAHTACAMRDEQVRRSAG